MLQLDEEFSLSQVFEQVPREQLVIPKLCVRKLKTFVAQESEAYKFRYDFLNGHDATAVLRAETSPEFVAHLVL